MSVGGVCLLFFDRSANVRLDSMSWPTSSSVVDSLSAAGVLNTAWPRIAIESRRFESAYVRSNSLAAVSVAESAKKPGVRSRIALVLW